MTFWYIWTFEKWNLYLIELMVHVERIEDKHIKKWKTKSSLKKHARREPKSYYSLFSELFRYHNNIILLIYPKILSENINVNTSSNSSKCWKRLRLGTGTRGMRDWGGEIAIFYELWHNGETPCWHTPHHMNSM